VVLNNVSGHDGILVWVGMQSSEGWKPRRLLLLETKQWPVGDESIISSHWRYQRKSNWGLNEF